MKQMQILGIDFGLRKIGLAVSFGTIAEPHSVIRFQNREALVKKIQKVIQEEKIEKVVIGVSESQMGKLSRKFGEEIGRNLNIPTTYFDETLSTQDAITLSRQTGMRSKKRKQLEDAFSAALILQRYLDETEFDK